jgi:hypothetical protein
MKKKIGSSKSMKKMQAGGQEDKKPKLPPVGIGTGRRKVQKLEKEGNSSNPTLDYTATTYQRTKNPKTKGSVANVSVDTSGYAGGKKEFPAVVRKTSVGSGKQIGSGNRFPTNRKVVDDVLATPSRSFERTTYKKGGMVGTSKMKMGGSCGTPKSLKRK